MQTPKVKTRLGLRDQPDIRKVAQGRVGNLEHGDEVELPDVIVASRKYGTERHDVTVSEALGDASNDGHVVDPAAITAL